MSKVLNNPLLKGVSGMLGDVIVYREHRGQMVMANKPRKTGKATLKQEAARDKFREAGQYAKAMVADPVTREEYQPSAKAKVSSAYTAALTDYLKGPEVKYVDFSPYKGAVGDRILIKAVDDFRVVSVLVRILAANDALVESGEAVLDQYGTLYVYTATVANATLTGTKIQVTVRDRPANITVNESIIP